MVPIGSWDIYSDEPSWNKLLRTSNTEISDAPKSSLPQNNHHFLKPSTDGFAFSKKYPNSQNDPNR